MGLSIPFLKSFKIFSPIFLVYWRILSRIDAIILFKPVCAEYLPLAHTEVIYIAYFKLYHIAFFSCSSVPYQASR